jgi:predicted porin
VRSSSFLWSHTDSFPVSAAYHFTATGEYEVNVANAFNYQDASGAPNSITADISGSYSFTLQGSLVSSIVSKRTKSLAKRATYDSCNGDRTSQIDVALTNTMKYLSNAVAYLNPLTSGRSRYVLWWGQSHKLTSVDDI